MKYLIAETISLKPHLETAGEVALQALSEGNQVTFAWLGDNLPWSDWDLPPIAHVFGCSLKRREKNFKCLLSKKGIAIYEYLSDEPFWKANIADWSNSFNGDLEALKKYSYHGAMLGMGVASSLISYTGDSLYNPQDDIIRTRKCLQAALLVYFRVQKAIKTLNPDVVITFNGRFATCKPIIIAAESLGIKILRHERGCNFKFYELYSDAIHNFDFINQRIWNSWNTANPLDRDLLSHQFFKLRRAGDGIGWHSFTSEQKKGLIVNRVPGKRRLVYFTSSDDEYAAVSDAYKPGPWPDQLAAVRDLISAKNTYSDLELVIRIHPHLKKKSAAERARWSSLKNYGLIIIGPNEKVDSYALIDSADIVATFGSTIGIEAAYWGKPSLLLGPCAYGNLGAVVVVKDKNEIERLLDPEAPPNPPVQEKCLPYGYYFLTYGNRFRYYTPESLSEGRLLGYRLGWDPWIVYILRKMHFGNLYRYIKSMINSRGK